MIHVKTYGPDGSHPKALCGAREPIRFTGIRRALGPWPDAWEPACSTCLYIAHHQTDTTTERTTR